MVFKKKLSSTLLLLSISTIIFFLFLILFPFISNKNKRVASNKLIIEGWLSAYDLEILKQTIDLKSIDTIYISGVRQIYTGIKPLEVKLPFTFFSNACIKLQLKDSTDYSLDFWAKGTPAMKFFPLITIAQENKVLTNIFVDSVLRKYTFSIKTNNAFNLYLYYNNDVSGNGEDRNLTLEKMSSNRGTISSVTIFPEYKIDFDKNAVYPFQSSAYKTANYAKLLFPEKTIIYIDTFASVNKTYAAAKKLGDFLKDKKPKRVNVVSIYGHSRRSYLAYKSNFPETEIGIISLDNRKYRLQKSVLRQLYQIADEYFSIVVTFVLCL